ncbi:hypothetical protein ACFL2Q_16755 [Thermodesulfobacteriota bacterium]
MGGLLVRSFRVLPNEGSQIMATVPQKKDWHSLWKGLNPTYYGLFVSLAVVTALALVFLLLGSIGIPIWGTATVIMPALL